jgi:selenocysteine-specific elongation factor
MAVKNIILGTAGHIDHGKTAFVRALTGIECDRLEEERRRGITIVLGYAHLTLPSGIKVGIVDVPGHERFVNRMVAGAAGIDVVALLVAAAEGIKPQTREHLYICEILGIKKGIVVLNKRDLADEELLFLQREEIAELTAGTFLADAPVIPVSSLTGEGLAEFVAALDVIAGEIDEKPMAKPFACPWMPWSPLRASVPWSGERQLLAVSTWVRRWRFCRWDTDHGSGVCRITGRP